MARTPPQRAAAASVPMLECPKCRWRAAAPQGWVAPFAVCPRCESRIPNPNPDAHVANKARSARKSKKAQKVPAGYEFTYSEAARRRGDAWIRNLTIIGLVMAAIAGTSWVVGKRRANSNASRAKGLYELVNAKEPATPMSGETPFEPALGEKLPGEPDSLPSGSLGWDNSSVFNAPNRSDRGDGLWDATEKDDAPLAPTTAGDFHDPAIPTFDGFK